MKTLYIKQKKSIYTYLSVSQRMTGAMFGSNIQMSLSLRNCFKFFALQDKNKQ